MSCERQQSIEKNLEQIRAQLPRQTALVAVSKTFPFAHIKMAYQAGQRHFGENRVEELKEKAEQALAEKMDIHWHFIGRPQTNKIKKLLGIPGLFAIHSIGSIKQVKMLIKLSTQQKGQVRLFFQVNITGEEQKSGFVNTDDLQQASSLLKEVSEKFPIAGLMAMSAIETSNFREDAHKCFGKLRELRDQINAQWQLSMGMGNDFQQAISHGADYVRIGQKIFGPRGVARQ